MNDLTVFGMFVFSGIVSFLLGFVLGQRGSDSKRSLSSSVRSVLGTSGSVSSPMQRDAIKRSLDELTRG